MNPKEEKIWKQIDEIRKQLWLSLIFFTAGMVLAWLGFSHFGDKFMNDIWNESVGRWPVYLLLGTTAGGLYMTIKYVSEKVEKGTGFNNALSGLNTIRLFYCVIILLSPVLFVALVLYRFYQLSKLINSLPDNRGQQGA